MGRSARVSEKPTAIKAASKNSAATRRAVAVTLKGSPAWKAWLEGLAAHCRSDVAKTIDKALVSLAEREGYEAKAPLR
jgi:hypothetical protein